jgi:FdhD protein
VNGASPTGPLPGVTGAVLAGGGSRRMGRDKRRLEVAGRPLLAHAVGAVGSLAERVLVAGGTTDAAELRALVAAVDAEVTVVPDRTPDGGPLAGLAAVLAASDDDLVVVVPGDHPMLVPAVLRLLVERLADADDASLAVLLDTDDRGPQPLLGAYRRAAGPVVQALLDRGERRARALLDALPHETVPQVRWAALDPDRASLVDLDTPADADVLAGDDGMDMAAAAPDHLRGTRVEVHRVTAGGSRPDTDEVVAEEPLRVRAAGPGQDPVEVVTTLRTPGHDADLVVGWLVSEGLVRPGAAPDVGLELGHPHTVARPEDEVLARLPHPLDLRAAAERRATATASCGVCGRASIDELAARLTPVPPAGLGTTVPWDVVASLPDRLREAQPLFARTGGLHATGIATSDGQLVTIREDVGRHNALDAAIGVHARRGELPLGRHLAVLSGRVGFELVAKIAAAGLPVLAAVGAPTDLAVRTADRLGITLVAFLRDGGGNVYTHPHRLDLPG